ncbi:MAG: hypothetical protein ACKV2V_26590 [Blastocatellia bacterium]
MKVDPDTIRAFNQLSREKRGKVEAIVRRHVAACYRNGFPPENLDRVYIEAMDVVRMEEKFPEPVTAETRDYEPVRHYDQYISPRAA